MKCWNPDCRNMLHSSAFACPVCGWERPKRGEGNNANDPLRNLCSDTDIAGNRCSKKGSMSSDTHGEGPWYCAQHFPPFRIHGGSHESAPRVEAHNSSGLTDQQWYNVCRFWPKVAARCERPIEQVGPGHELEATSGRGPLLGGRAPTPAREREPGEEG